LLKKFQMRNGGYPIPIGGERGQMNLTDIPQQNENHMLSYSYEKIKDEHSISINMSILNKINGQELNNGRNF